jgi:2-methylcitrate dehydratase PrpD
MRLDRNARDQTEDGGLNLPRRILLQRAGLVAGAAMIPGVVGQSMVLAADNISPVMTKLSAYMSEAASRALPDEVIEKAKQHILDTIAAMVSGSELAPGHAALKFAGSYGGDKISTVVGSNIVCGPIEAALTNGLLAHSDETDDSHAPSESHPGASAVPAALAVGEKFGINGTHFIRAVTLGYDIGPRVNFVLGGRQFRVESHRATHSIAGNFGAAAAAGSAASLNPQQMRWLLDYASQEASGIAAWQRDTDHIEKGFVFAGGPARNGTTAALLVQSGWTGVDDIFSGADNYFLANQHPAEPVAMIEKLGERYEIVGTNIKKWTVGSPIQAPLDAIENLLKKHPFNADQVQSAVVRVATSEASIVDDREVPDICLQYMVAVMLIDKTATFKAAHTKVRMQDPEVIRQRAKVHLIKDNELQALLPRRDAIVEITLTDGTNLTDHVEAVRGTTENPMTREEVVAKCTDLMAPVLGAGKTKTLIEKIFNLEKIKDIRELRSLLQLA